MNVNFFLELDEADVQRLNDLATADGKTVREYIRVRLLGLEPEPVVIVPEGEEPGAPENQSFGVPNAFEHKAVINGE